jgi:ribosomal protein S18 acetylase RimI-like enzyme
LRALAKIRNEKPLPVVVDRMRPDEAIVTAELFTEVVTALPYYNQAAKASELAKYSPSSLLDSLLNDPDSILIARTSDKVVGFCFNHNDDGVIWLSWFGVHPDYRGMGVGSALLRKLEETVSNGRSHKIWCDCRTENEGSKYVLSKEGYTELCTVLNHWYGQDFILWQKPVS